jgi:hypothetical protein
MEFDSNLLDLQRKINNLQGEFGNLAEADISPGTRRSKRAVTFPSPAYETSPANFYVDIIIQTHLNLQKN